MNFFTQILQFTNKTYFKTEINKVKLENVHTRVSVINNLLSCFWVLSQNALNSRGINSRLMLNPSDDDDVRTLLDNLRNLHLRSNLI